MEEALWEWLTDKSAEGEHPRLPAFWQGRTLPVLLGLFVFVNLLIPPMIVFRCFRRLLSKNSYRW